MGCALALGALLSCTEDAPKRAEDGANAAVTAPVPRARLRELKGTVNVKRAAGDDWAVAQEGMELFESDKIRTSLGASVVVETASGSLTLGEDALIGITEDTGNVTLFQGHIDARLRDANKSLIIKTPAAEVKAGREIFFQ